MKFSRYVLGMKSSILKLPQGESSGASCIEVRIRMTLKESIAIALRNELEKLIESEPHFQHQNLLKLAELSGRLRGEKITAPAIKSQPAEAVVN